MPDKFTVLLVDDEKDVLFMIGERIRSWKFELATASSGKEALAMIADSEPDIVVLDYLMPDMDGIETLKEVRKIAKDLPVIMFTAHPDKKSIEGTERLGVNFYIPKLSVYSDASSALKSAIDICKKKIKPKP